MTYGRRRSRSGAPFVAFPTAACAWRTTAAKARTARTSVRRPCSRAGSSTAWRFASLVRHSVARTQRTGSPSTSPATRSATPASPTATDCRASPPACSSATPSRGSSRALSCCGFAGPSCAASSMRLWRARSGRRRSAGLSSSGSRTHTRHRLRCPGRRVWPARCQTPSPAASATSSISPAAGTPSTERVRRRCSRSRTGAPRS